MRGSREDSTVLSMVLAGLMAAVIYIATTVVRIPTPTGGFMNLGDGFILFSAWLLGPIYGFAAAGIGSALCDLLAGYNAYIVGTFFIKGFMAVLAWLGYRMMAGVWGDRRRNAQMAAYLVGGILAELWMVAGYFGYEALFLGYGFGAIASVFSNLVQGVIGVISGTVFCLFLFPILARQRIYCPAMIRKQKGEH